jgi:hypothetical protein
LGRLICVRCSGAGCCRADAGSNDAYTYNADSGLKTVSDEGNLKATYIYKAHRPRHHQLRLGGRHDPQRA